MPSANHRHPEFGYFWLSHGLRRVAKLALAFIVLASMAAASQLIVAIAQHEPNTGDAPALAALPFEPDPAPAGLASPAPLAPSAGAPSVSPRSAPSVSPRSAPIEASASLTIKPPRTQLIAEPKKLIASPKTPRKAARSQPRRRDRDPFDAYASPRRADSWSPRDYGYSHFWRPGW
jgi:hypothetical protein